MNKALIENKFSKYIASPEGFWNDYLENNRKLTPDEQQQYKNICEVYSDLYAMFMVKKAFTWMEVKSLLKQYSYFKKEVEYFETPYPSYVFPTRILKEIEVMKRNLSRYFEQFTESNEAFEGGN